MLGSILNETTATLHYVDAPKEFWIAASDLSETEANECFPSLEYEMSEEENNEKILEGAKALAEKLGIESNGISVQSIPEIYIETGFSY